MIEINASVTSTRTSITSYQATSERNALAVRSNGNNKPPSASVLNNQQNQIVDEVGISQEAIAQFEEAQRLNEQIRAYSGYLNGDDAPSSVISFVANANDNDADVEIAGQSTKLSASITVAEYSEETLSLSAKIDDDGNLTELTISKESISAQYISAEITSEEFSFYARG